MNLSRIFMLTALSAALSTAALARDAEDVAKDRAKADYKATVEQADAHYKSAKAHCKTLSGNERDVCMKQAKADYTSAKADAKAQRKDAVAHADALEDKMEARYDAEKEKCDALSGAAKDDCVAAAKLKYKQ